jgi:hypothetical protein
MGSFRREARQPAWRMPGMPVQAVIQSIFHISLFTFHQSPLLLFLMRFIENEQSEV